LSAVRLRVGHKHESSIRAYTESRLPQERKDRTAVLAKRIADTEVVALELKNCARAAHKQVENLMTRVQSGSQLTTAQLVEQLHEIAAALKVSNAAP